MRARACTQRRRRTARPRASRRTRRPGPRTVFGSKTLHRYSSKVGAAVRRRPAAHSVVASLEAELLAVHPARRARPTGAVRRDALKSAEGAATAARKAVAASCAQHAAFVKVASRPAESLLGQLHEQSIADSAAAPRSPRTTAPPTPTARASRSSPRPRSRRRRRSSVSRQKSRPGDEAEVRELGVFGELEPIPARNENKTGRQSESARSRGAPPVDRTLHSKPRHCLAIRRAPERAPSSDRAPNGLGVSPRLRPRPRLPRRAPSRRRRRAGGAPDAAARVLRNTSSRSCTRCRTVEPDRAHLLVEFGEQLRELRRVARREREGELRADVGRELA